MREPVTKYGTLVITDGLVVEWFTSLHPKPHKQDEWVQEVTRKNTAVVDGYSLELDPLELEIEYKYLRNIPNDTTI